MGTTNGLNRYDGRDIKVYRNVASNPQSLGNDFVCSLLEVGGNLYVDTAQGLFVFNRTSESFSLFDKSTRYDVRICSEVRGLMQTSGGLIWIATWGQGCLSTTPPPPRWCKAAFIRALCRVSVRERVGASTSLR